MCNRKLNYLILILILNATAAFAAKISGFVRNEEGEILPFATVYVKEKDFGTTSNLEGYYEIELGKGSYTLIFQFLGYEKVIKTLRVDNIDLDLDVVLKSQSLVLPNLVYRAGEEDPAYEIMRRVIAKSKYHLYQLNSYKTKVYVKGSGRLKKAPFFLRNRLKKEGIDSSRVFMVESLSEIEFKLPNTYTERVISVNSTDMDNTPDPMPFIKASFYQPRVGEALSPISPGAFSHYQYRYEGFFKDQEVIVNKIYVEPRIKGDMVFEGFLYIIEDLWALHSLDFNTHFQGFDVNIKQVYRPVRPTVWMPVTHRFDVKGSIMGFDFEFKYVAVNNDYEVVLNDQLIQPDINASPVSVPDPLNQKSGNIPFENIKPGEELTNKEMRKMMRDYEKQALQEVDSDDRILFRENITFDSAAYKKDSLFWSGIRPVPLSSLEIKSYELRDSLSIVRKEEDKRDSIRKEKNKNFRIQHILTGNVYSISEKTSLGWRSLWNKISFNTVEGWNLNAGMDLKYQIDSSRSISLGPTLRYGFSSRQWYGVIYAKYNFKRHFRFGELKIVGGKYIYQINSDDPIPSWLNMISSLFFRENFMKLHGRKYIDISIENPLSSKIVLFGNARWEDKSALENTTDFSFTDQEKEYAPNNPENILIGDTRFSPYTLFSLDFAFEYYPFLKFFERNGERTIIQESSPVLSLGYAIGISPDNRAEVSFHRINAGIRYGKTFGVGNRIEMHLAGSRIFTKEPNTLPFPEFSHFSGNKTPILTEDLIASYRMLDYYYYSANRYHIESHLLYQFRRLLITQIVYARMAGIREDLMVKYLYANSLENYMEIGYALDNLLNFFRLEVVGQFDNFSYRSLGVRIGFSKNISLD